MFKQIVVPINLGHVDQLEKSLKIAADVSKHFEAPVNRSRCMIERGYLLRQAGAK